MPIKKDRGILTVFGAKWKLQKYNPPDVGNELASSLIPVPIANSINPDKNQPHIRPIGPMVNPMDNVLAMLGTRPMVENPM
jgi:hypothetical protein